MSGVAASVTAAALAMQTRALDFLDAASSMGIVDDASFTHALKLLAQHLCTSVPDRNEYRQHAAAGVSRLLSIMSDEAQEVFLPWLLKFARNAKAGFRTFALDAAGSILTVRVVGGGSPSDLSLASVSPANCLALIGAFPPQNPKVLVASDVAKDSRKRLFQLILT